MRFQLSDLIARPEPSPVPALALWLAFTAAAALVAALGILAGAV